MKELYNGIHTSFELFDRVWLLTWTTYGTWLPGDERGFVSPKFEGSETQKRNNQVGEPSDQGRPELRQLARVKLKGEPIYLKSEHADVLAAQFNGTALYHGWKIIVASILSNHIHLLVGVHTDPDPAAIMRDFKAYASRALNIAFQKPASGTWWTEQGSRRKVKDASHFRNAVKYILRQQNPLLIIGERGA